MTAHTFDAHANAVSIAPATVLRGVATRVAQLWTALKNRREVNGLGELDAYMLKDIGLTPSDVAAALDCPLTEDPSRHLTRVAAGRPKYRVS